ncbi:hypothetical protein NQ317_017204 [Molorchus minor]|uniref:Endonuclease/exonuclease/phosphatase domain-containing protein n=1 Tax=Molorchus minor TaxID=1323400 RepID=A0ABQ9JYJ7_9CUCU|nr:hypothetical protein NQ317_017204 [Molorchus minor]
MYGLESLAMGSSDCLNITRKASVSIKIMGNAAGLRKLGEVSTFIHEAESEIADESEKTFRKNGKAIEASEVRLKNTIEASEVRLLLKIEELNHKIISLENENLLLKNKVEELDRNSRQKNIIIFGLNKKTDEIAPEYICQELKTLLDVNVTASSISNIYSLGKAENSPIKVELVSYMKKREILQHCYRLKGTNITIAHDLTPQQREEHRVLRNYQKKIRENNSGTSYIKRGKIYINNVGYTCEEIGEIEDDVYREQNTGNSAPSTPINATTSKVGENTSEQFTHRPEVIVLTETHQVEDLSIYNIKGYEIIYNDGKYNQNDGTIMYVKNDLEYNYKIINLSEKNRAILLNLMFSGKIIKILSLYKNPPYSVPEFIDSLRNTFIDLNIGNCDYFMVVGDINIDILEKEIHATVVDYLNLMNEMGMVSLINDYTRVTESSKTCLDHIFIKTNTDKELLLPIIIKTTLTDHYCTYLQIVINGKGENKYAPKTNLFKNINYKALGNLLQNESWDTVYNIKGAEPATKEFIQILNKAIQNSTFIVKTKNRKRKVWITNGLIKSINKRDDMYHNLLKNQGDENLKNNYKIYRNKVNKLIKAAKQSYYKNQIKLNSNDNSKLWNIISEISEQKKKVNIKSITVNEEKIYDVAIITNKFNDYYIDVGKKLAEKNSAYKEA